MPSTPSSIEESLEGLAPEAWPGARVLILGSMPGARSLEEVRYYAHPRNAFWTILADWIDTPSNAPYAERIDALHVHGIALWDVIGRCRRPGSLDSRIDSDSVETNDLVGLFARCPAIERVLLNGARAYQEYRRRVLPGLEGWASSLPVIRLPSTSPAHAAMSLEAKQDAWGDALRPVLGSD